MDASFHIVGCVISSKPAPELIDTFVAHVRRERGAVLVKSAQGATFVRFGASDARLVSTACTAAAAPGPSRLRFGFAVGTKEPAAAGRPTAGGAGDDGLDVSTRSIVQANELAAAAEDGEVLVSPHLAVWLVEAGVSLRSKQASLPGGRILPACTLDLAPAVPAAPATDKAAARAPDSLAVPTEAKARARASGGLAPLSAVPPPPHRVESDDEVSPSDLHRVEPVAEVFRALRAQAEEIARRQAEVEARQDAVLAKMTLADQGALSTRHLDAMESELEAQVARVEGRLDFVDKLEQRVGNVVSVIADVERRLSAQLHRRSEVESLKVLCDTLLAQLVEAQPRLEVMTAVQERLLPMSTAISALTQSVSDSRRGLSELEERLAALGHVAASAEARMGEVAAHKALVLSLKADVERLQEAGQRGRADFQHVVDRQGELAEMRQKVDALLARVGETDGRMAEVEARRAMVEEAQSRVNQVTHLLGDIELKLELLNEQRVEVEHVGDKVARLDFAVQEAQNTLRALQREREVAERIEQGIRSLRARSGAGQPI